MNDKGLGAERLTVTRRSLAGTAGGSGLSAHFLVFEEGGCRLVPLPESGELTLGRDAGVDLRLEDAAVSRRHAKVVVARNHVVLTDLGSHNGTQVNGSPVLAPRPLSSGDVVTLCSTQLVFNVDARPSPARETLSPIELRARAEEEIERATRFDRPATLLCVKPKSVDPQTLRGALEALEGRLRLIDAVSCTASGELWLLLPELEPGADDELSELRQVLQAVLPDARFGAAVCPADAADPDAWMGGAQAAAEAASPGQLLRPADLSQTRTIAGRRVLIADPAMVRVYALVDRLAASDLPVLIGGETGSGKELIAHALHEGSRRRAKPLIGVNCAALPEGLVESELFGHAKGAFSGAVGARVGFLEAADGGTIFFDEIGELPLAAQAKLLRVLETRKVLRVGEVQERPVDLRIVAATHRDLAQEVEAGRFRQDLLFRLGAARIVLPPLRHRPREIAVLAQALLAEACVGSDRAAMTLSTAAVAVLRAHRWPGNIRELKNAMELLAATVVEAVVQPWHLEEVLGTRPKPPPSARTAAPPPPAGTEGAPTSFRPIDEEVRALERARMIQALQAADGVKKHAAQLLSMPLRTFVTKYKLYAIATSQDGEAGAP